MNPVLTANAAKSLVSLSDKYLQSLMPCEKKKSEFVTSINKFNSSFVCFDFENRISLCSIG